MLDSEGAGSHLLGNLVRRIRGSIINHNHLIRLRDYFHRRANTIQAFPDPSLFIVGENDEGNHSGKTLGISGVQSASAAYGC